LSSAATIEFLRADYREDRILLLKSENCFDECSETLPGPVKKKLYNFYTESFFEVSSVSLSPFAF
jgi:hypothetical protein